MLTETTRTAESVRWNGALGPRCFENTRSRGIAKLDALENALAGEPWAFSGLLHGIPDALDTEGRPIGERRASPPAKEGVEIELRPCPYSDDRRGQPMNLSAFKQVMRHWDTVVEDIRAFHRELPATIRGRFRLLAMVADQLARPATFLLAAGKPSAQIPAAIAVAHKLAAGFFGAANGQLPELAGDTPRAQAEALMGEVLERKLLFGASEVCAGPANLIERAALALVTPEGAGTVPFTPRAERAILLATQLRVGSFLTAEDLALERWLLSVAADGGLRPRNDYMRRAMDRRRDELANRPSPTRVELAVPKGLCPEILAELRSAPKDLEVHAHPWRAPIEQALAHPDDGALHATPAVRAQLIPVIVRYLARRRTAIRTQWRLEMALRATVSRDLEGPLRRNALLIPGDGARRWLDAALGHRIEVTVAAEPTARLWNPKRSIAIV